MIWIFFYKGFTYLLTFKVAPIVSRIRKISDGKSLCKYLVDRFPAILPI